MKMNAHIKTKWKHRETADSEEQRGKQKLHVHYKIISKVWASKLIRNTKWNICVSMEIELIIVDMEMK